MFARPYNLTMTYCLVCYYDTVENEFDICPVCFWEREEIDEAYFNTPTGGPNEDLSVIMARRNFKEFGASQKRLLAYVIPPDPSWKHSSEAESREAIQDRQTIGVYEYFATWDPMWLISEDGAPRDEYNLEVNKIIGRYKPEMTKMELAELVYRIFVNSMEVDPPGFRDQCLGRAAKIQLELNQYRDQFRSET